MRTNMKKAGPLVVAALLIGGLGAVVAQAAIPNSSTGVITGCYTAGVTVRPLSVINAENGVTCPSGTNTLTWNQAGPQGPAGPTGATGATGAMGATGSAGVSGYQVVSASFTETATYNENGGADFTPDPNPYGAHVVDCPAGKVPVGGGYSDLSGPVDNEAFTDAPTATGWQVNIGGNVFSTYSVTVYAICVNAT